MYAGVHNDYLWEIDDGKLVIRSSDPKLGVIKIQAVNNRFNNAEQATWFAQGHIDTQSDQLAELLHDKQQRSG